MTWTWLPIPHGVTHLPTSWSCLQFHPKCHHPSRLASSSLSFREAGVSCSSDSVFPELCLLLLSGQGTEKPLSALLQLGLASCPAPHSRGSQSLSSSSLLPLWPSSQPSPTSSELPSSLSQLCSLVTQEPADSSSRKSPESQWGGYQDETESVCILTQRAMRAAMVPVAVSKRATAKLSPHQQPQNEWGHITA